MAAAIRPDRYDVVNHFDREAGEFRDEDRCESCAVGALVGVVAARRRGDLVEVRVAATCGRQTEVQEVWQRGAGPEERSIVAYLAR